jgi:lipopolysaccharide/colanic/teichoic acid biosynthesis glycosyltransferase
VAHANLLDASKSELERVGATVVGAVAWAGDEHAAEAFDDIVDACRRAEATDVVVFARGLKTDSASLLADHLEGQVPVALYVVPDGDDDPSLAAHQLLHPPLTPAGLLAKRASDIAIAAAALALVSPLLLLSAACIKLESRGPVLFRQLRHGYSRKPIAVLKLRTMCVGADKDGDTTTRAGDARVTRIGRILRATNIDELPQLFNVLAGDMSLVGPRPHAIAENEFFESRIPGYVRRTFVKPGITGWAQVNGARGPAEDDTTMGRRVQLDLFYIENWSLLLDFKCMWMTVFARSAYKDAF